MGLSGAGKTTLAKNVVNAFREYQCTATWLNADEIRELTNNWDFTNEGRILQAHTLRRMADDAPTDIVVADFIAPLPEQRSIFNPDFIVWVDTVNKSKYEDTDQCFQAPAYCDYYISEHSDNHAENILMTLFEKNE